MKLSIVVPVFNEEAVKDATHKKIAGFLEDLKWKTLVLKWSW
jgi:glycosyltransferase involved in cell wall biosynthesis